MSLGRNLTKKSSRYGFNGSSDRSEDSSSKRSSISKHKISAPVALLSTTNMLSYTAPSLRNSLSQNSMSSASSASSSPTSLRSPTAGAFSDNDSDHSDSSSPTMPRNHLSSYFASGASVEIPPPPPTALPAPVVRSQSTRTAPRPRMPPPSRWSGQQHTTSNQHQQLNPFGAELAQVAEMTEEIAGMNVGDAEEEFMRSRGLRRFKACDYEEEIWQGAGGVFEDELPSFSIGWI